MKIGTILPSEAKALVFLWDLRAFFQRFQEKHVKFAKIRHF